MKIEYKALVAVAAMLASSAQAEQTSVTFNLIDTGGTEQGSLAYQGFKAAADYWSSVLTTSQPVTINLATGFGKLGPDVLGSTGSSFTSKAIVNVENRILARQSTAFDASLALPALRDGYFGANDAVDVYTPGYTGFDVDGNPYGIDNSVKVYDTDSSYNNSVIGLTTANAKALGYTFGDNIDASITFSSEFAFDFRPADGITAGYSDFLAVAIHEIGHALGFVSGVDDYDYLGGPNGPAKNADCGGFECMDYPANDDWFGETLDLFRYSAPGVLDWTTNTASYFSADGGLTAYDNGYFSTGTFHGDGWQASHWKAPQVTLDDGSVVFSCAQPKLGIMNPYACNGRQGILTGLDLAAFDAIGWNTSLDLSTYAETTGQIGTRLGLVPEPAEWVLLMMGFGMVGGAMRRKRRTLSVSYA